MGAPNLPLWGKTPWINGWAAGTLSYQNMQLVASFYSAVQDSWAVKGLHFTPNNADLITKSLSHKSDFCFLPWLCCSFSLTLTMCPVSPGKVNTSPYVTQVYLIIAHKHWTCKCSCRMYEEHSVLLTMRQMTIEFLWKTKIHCSGGSRTYNYVAHYLDTCGACMTP